MHSSCLGRGKELLTVTALTDLQTVQNLYVELDLGTSNKGELQGLVLGLATVNHVPTVNFYLHMLAL